MSTIHPLRSYGLNPGSGLILDSVLTWIGLILLIYVDYGSLLVYSVRRGIAPESSEIFFLVLYIIELLANLALVWYGTIIEGQVKALKIWMGFLGTLFILEMISFFIIIGSEWEELGALSAFESTYIIFYECLIVAYAMQFYFQLLPYFGVMDELTPMGKGISFVFDYFKRHAKEAAALFLMLETVYNLQEVFEKQSWILIFGHKGVGYEKFDNVAIVAEETIIRYFRIGLGIVGFYLTYKEKKYWMYRWCLAYLATVAASLGIFVYLVFAWRAEHFMLTLLYFIMFLTNLMYRLGLLFISVRYTDVFERSGIPM